MSVISWFFIKKKYRKKTCFDKGEMVSVIIPSKGEINLKKFEEQEYENYEIIVVVDEIEEKNKIEKIKGEMTTVEISKNYDGCSGKNSALLTAIEKARGEIFVFADDDIEPHPKWLQYLVSSMEEISTTYRWYFKRPFLCVWNASVASVLFYKRFNFAWGGSTAIRKDVFEKLNIREIWKKNWVDDLTLTKILKKNGIEIKFVPQAISESREEKEVFKWMNREFAWIRRYFPFLWRTALFFNLGMRISNIIGMFYIFINPLTGFLLISPLLFDFLRGYQEYSTFVQLMEYPKEKFLSPVYHILLRPVASFAISYNLISSIFINKVEWKGKTYSIPKVSHQIKF